MAEGRKLHGSDSAWDVANNDIEHASDIADGSPTRHAPLGAAIGDILVWDGSKWILLADVAVGQLLASGGVGAAPSYTPDPSVTGTVAAKPAGTAGLKLDPNSATGNFIQSLSTANLTGNRRHTFPNYGFAWPATNAPGVLASDGAGLSNWLSLFIPILFSYNTASDIGGYKKALTTNSTGGVQSVTSGSITAAAKPGDLIQAWASEPGVPGTTFISDGIWHLHLHALRASGTKDVRLYVDMYYRNLAGAETLIASSEFSNILTDVEAEYDIEKAVSSVSLLATDRIVYKVYAIATGVGSAPTATIKFEGTSDSRLEFPSLGGGNAHAHVIQDEGTPVANRANLNFAGAGVTVTDDAGNDASLVTIPGGGGSAHVIQEEGTPLTARANLNFVGAGVTATDDAGNDATVVTIPGGGGSLAWFNVKDYGAAGDGTTDDTGAIEDAIADMPARGGCLYFPTGQYKIVSTITFNKPASVILGDGSEYGASEIHMATADTRAFTIAPTLDGTRNQTNLIRGLLISGPGGGSSGAGVYASSDVHLEDVGITGFYDGLYWDSVTFYSRAYGCFFTDNTRAGVVMADVNNCTLDTCRFTGDFGGGGLIGPMQYGVFIGCTFPRGLNIRIVNCSIEYFSKDGIYASGMFSGEISGNYFETQQSSTGYAHVNLGPANGCRAVFIHGNYLQGDGVSGFNAIKGTTTDRITVANNYFGINGAIGIAASGGGNTNWLLINNYNNPAGTFSLPASSYTLDPATPPLNNPMTVLGDVIYGDTGGAAARLAGNTTTTRKFLRQVGSGAASAAPAWDTIAVSDVSGLASSGELLMQDGVTAPPVPIETEDQTDWLYQG
jgi:hypothetical protein